MSFLLCSPPALRLPPNLGAFANLCDEVAPCIEEPLMRTASRLDFPPPILDKLVGDGPSALLLDAGMIACAGTTTIIAHHGRMAGAFPDAAYAGGVAATAPARPIAPWRCVQRPRAGFT